MFTESQDSAMECARHLKEIARHLRSHAIDLDNFVHLIDQMVNEGTPITGPSFVANVSRVGTSALMNNNPLASLEAAVYQAAMAVRLGEQGK